MAKKEAKKTVKGSAQKILDKQNVEISPDMQETLNKPLEGTQTFESADREFLEMLLKKIEKGEIELYTPATLINHEVYDKLDEKGKGKADFDAVNLLSALRDINKLCKAGSKDTFQTQNMVHRIRITKERLEEISGDIYII